MIHTADKPSFPLSQTVMTIVAVAVTLGAATAGTLYAIGAASQLPVALAVGGVCLAAALISLLPVWLLTGRQADGTGVGFLAGMLIRMGLTLGLIYVLSVSGVWQSGVVWFWSGGWYLALLATEVVMIHRFLAQCQATQQGEQAK